MMPPTIPLRRCSLGAPCPKAFDLTQFEVSPLVDRRKLNW
jgi:hypothetical protein